jgi:hypothetical protein
MSMQSRTLDRASRLADELVVDALFIVRRHPWHWPAVAGGVALGFAGGYAITGIGFLPFAAAFVCGGLGMNIGSDFRFITRTPTRVLLMDSSRVIGLPTSLLREVQPADVVVTPSGPALHLLAGGEVHVMARQHATRLQRMLHIPAADLPAEPVVRSQT